MNRVAVDCKLYLEFLRISGLDNLVMMYRSQG